MKKEESRARRAMPVPVKTRQILKQLERDRAAWARDHLDVIAWGRYLEAKGMIPAAILRTVAAVESDLAALAPECGLELNSKRLVELEADKLAKLLRRAPQALFSPRVIQAILTVRQRIESPPENLTVLSNEEGFELFYRAGGIRPPRIPHTRRDGNLVVQENEAGQRARARQALQPEDWDDTPIASWASSPKAMKPSASTENLAGEDVQPQRDLRILRAIAKAIMEPAPRYKRANDAKLFNAIALRDRKLVLQSAMRLTEDKAWRRLASGLGGMATASRRAAAIRRFVERTLEDVEAHPHKYSFAYSRKRSPLLEKALADADRRATRPKA
jgi:hypothetical protein